jgi:hypothetical protein
VINAANIASNPVTTLAWDIASEVSKSLRFVREIVIDWDMLPSSFTADYCLVFDTRSCLCQLSSRFAKGVHPERRRRVPPAVRANGSSPGHFA